MKIIRNSISQELWKKCIDKLNSCLSEDTWKVSTILWPEGIKRGITGSCLIKKIDDELRTDILLEIKDILPYCNSISMNYHVWLPNSGISSHDDSNHKFGATLYLNKNWDIDFGGLFVWEEYGSSTMNALVPECKTLVLNDSHEKHLVTAVSNYIPEPRISIQIFGS